MIYQDVSPNLRVDGLRGHQRGESLAMVTKFVAFLRNESGATAIEYGLVAGLIGVVVISAVTRVGTKVSNQFVTLGNALK
jgi:pilus assembly protein Flp/PilA